MVKTIRWGQLSAISCFISLLLSVSFAQTEDNPAKISDQPPPPKPNLPRIPGDPTTALCGGPGGNPTPNPGPGGC